MPAILEIMNKVSNWNMVDSLSNELQEKIHAQFVLGSIETKIIPKIWHLSNDSQNDVLVLDK